MKKSYETPSIEVVKFQYRDQVVATSGGSATRCHIDWVNHGSWAVEGCHTDGKYVGETGA